MAYYSTKVASVSQATVTHMRRERAEGRYATGKHWRHAPHRSVEVVGAGEVEQRERKALGHVHLDVDAPVVLAPGQLANAHVLRCTATKHSVSVLKKKQ